MIKKTAFILLTCAVLVAFIYAKNKSDQEKLSVDVVPFGKQNNWLTYNISHEKILKKQKVRSVKAVFYQIMNDDSLSYLVSTKRSANSDAKKDGRYEFLGGKVDKKERVLTALIREVSEEDPSLILTKHLKKIIRHKPDFLRYKLVQLKNGSSHAIFVIPVQEENWNALEKFYQSKKNDHETYGFERLDESYFSLAKGKKKNWTPQTIRLFKALRRESKG